MAVEDRVTAELALGRHTAAAVTLETLTPQHPLRERFWALRAVALQRSGRQADALATLRELREVLDSELGLDPSPEVRDLETALLRQDPALAWSPPAPGTPEPTVAAPEPATTTAAVVPPAALAPGRPGGGARCPGGCTAAGRRRIAGIRGPDRRAGHRQVPARRRDRGAGRGGGARVLLGRCSQDDGAPPLWPWRGVLAGLGTELPATRADRRRGRPVPRLGADRRRPRTGGRGPAHGGAPRRPALGRRFDAAGARPADRGGDNRPAAGGRHLAGHREVGPALADVAEALARRHAVRIDLAGLSEEAARDVFTEVSHNEITPDQAAALRDRTAGNPFFLVEYARLAGERSDVGRLLAERQPPAAVVRRGTPAAPTARRQDRRGAADRRRGRPPVRHRHAGRGHRDRPGRCSSTWSSRRRPPGWWRRTRSTGTCSPTRWSATPS